MTVWRSNATPRLDTLLLVLTACAALIVARTNAAWSPTSMAVRAVCELVVTVALSFALSRRAKSLPQAQGFTAIAVCVAVAYPFAGEFAMRHFFGGSEPLEVLMLTSLQLTAVVLAVFCHVPRLGNSAVLLSSFLFLFVMAITSDRIALMLAGIYGVLILWWLMGAYWDRLAGAFVASTVERRTPVRLPVIGGTAIVLLLMAALISTKGGAAVALPGFLPTSGGTRWHDPYAGAGVGDGDAMIAANEEAMSFGPVESELFLDSDMPSLYDMFNDMYGEPPNPEKKQERAIGMSPTDVKETEQQIARTERSGREFSATRRKVERKPLTLDNRKTPAMLYVVGSVPLHLALERFDTFDGRVWTHSGEHEERQAIRLSIQNGKPWAYLMEIGSSPIHRGVEPHAVKLINLKTNRFPSSPQLTALHIDRVNHPDFFGWTDDGVARMPAHDHIPQLTVVHVRSQGVNLQSLREADFTARFPAVSSGRQGDDRTAVDVRAELIARHLRVPASSGAVSQTADAWTCDLPRGWRQVESVVERLRSDFTLDPRAETPADCPDVVSHFLQARRGPDYLFATTAAILLRERGYPTRLVTGFYADRDRYDHRAGQTTVLAEDVHVWVEVNIDGRTWVPVEPTPGYEPPRESLTWRQRAAQFWHFVCQWFEKHLAALALGLAVAVTGWITRIRWLDGAFMFFCRIAGKINSRRRVLWTMRLLEWRAWLAGHSRPRSKTLSSWHGALADSLPEATATCLQSALQSAESLLYASGNSPASDEPPPELLAACALVEQRVGTSCFLHAFDDCDS